MPDRAGFGFVGPMAARKKPELQSRKMFKQLPRPSVLMREALRSLFTEAQCEAAGRDVNVDALLKQAEALLTSLRVRDDGPVTRSRLSWLAELTVSLRDAHEGHVPPELEARRRALAEATSEVEALRVRLASGMTLLVGGDETRGAALAIASTSLESLSKLLTAWRAEARLRVLADELGLDDGVRAEVEVALEALSQPDVVVVPLKTQAGRLRRELSAIEAACRVVDGAKPRRRHSSR